MEEIEKEHNRAFCGLSSFTIDLIDQLEEEGKSPEIILREVREFLKEMVFQKGKSIR